MRIFLISNMFPSNNDPLFGVFVKNFKLEFEKQGVNFSKTSLIKGKAGSIKKILSYSKHYVNIIRHFFSFKYDLIYLHYLTHHIPVLLLLIPFKKKPFVLNVHGSDVIGLQHQRILNFLAKKILKRIDLVVVPTSYFKDYLLSKYSFLKANKITISPSGGIDKNKFYFKKDAKNTEMFSLGFISRFIEEKGWLTFLDALILLKKQGVVFNAIIAGKGPDEEKILKYISDNSLVNQITFLGLIKQEKLIEIYNQLDLYIFPTYREAESLGLTGLEAMSCGIPVIACDIGGPKTYIKHGENGYLFEPKNSSDLVKFIMLFYNMEDSERIKLGSNALNTAKKYENTEVAINLKKDLENRFFKF